MTVYELVPLYLRYCQVERFIAPASLEKYAGCCRVWILPNLGGISVEDVGRTDISRLRERMSDQGMSRTAQYNVLVIVRAVFAYARKVHRIDCITSTEIELPERGRLDVRFLQKEEVQRLCSGIDSGTYAGLRLRAFVELLLGTGLRLSEALSLMREPIDMGQREIEIIGKGNKRRAVFLTDRCMFWLQQYLSKRHDSEPWLFVTTGNSPRKWAKADIARFFINLRLKLGIPRLTPHVLRHTYCSNLLENGVDIFHIKELAGHSDIQTTARYYLGVDRRALRKIVDQHVWYGNDLTESDGAAIVQARQVTRTQKSSLPQTQSP